MYGGNKLSSVAVLTWTKDGRELLFYRPVTYSIYLWETERVQTEDNIPASTEKENL